MKLAIPAVRVLSEHQLLALPLEYTGWVEIAVPSSDRSKPGDTVVALEYPDLARLAGVRLVGNTAAVVRLPLQVDLYDRAEAVIQHERSRVRVFDGATVVMHRGTAELHDFGRGQSYDLEEQPDGTFVNPDGVHIIPRSTAAEVIDAAHTLGLYYGETAEGLESLPEVGSENEMTRTMWESVRREAYRYAAFRISGSICD